MTMMIRPVLAGLLAASTLIAAPSAVTAQEAFPSHARDGRPLIIAHRGGAQLQPENTLIAFQNALDLGADGVETDVLLTKDGQLVLNHDFTLDADLARGPDQQWNAPQTPIRAMTLAEIRRYDVGRPDPASDYAAQHPDLEAHDDVPVPLLGELLALMAQHDDDSELWLEIKSAPIMGAASSDPQVMAQAVAQALAEADFASRTKVLSFDWNVLRALHAIAPDLRLVYLSYDIERAARLHPESFPVPADTIMQAMTGRESFQEGGIVPTIAAEGAFGWDAAYADFTPQDITAAREAGLEVGAWTVDDPGTARLLYNIGVDAITTDRPDLMVAEFAD
ncbi:glycerophosphodiester phosphodiesterase family protein [Altericroceibacterium endophyticum]|uniref:GP-PDE domain-containing protein n=1 Tax=Altericroceibacterium endophyticum TaxID=1808508 RepID=A0A6I4T6H8_9SPHN|nr:glycerophosphodiester phosphodiesterase family protein [Altericroceibacterium endophyticum]MXO65405.1 hypothetical protein [Altericroceibacterium endophyticum]